MTLIGELDYVLNSLRLLVNEVNIVSYYLYLLVLVFMDRLDKAGRAFITEIN